MAVDVLCHEGALGDHRQFLGAEILQYGARQLRADALSFVFFGNLGVRQDDESLRLDVFDHGEVPAEVEFVSLFRSVVDQFVFLFHNPEF